MSTKPKKPEAWKQLTPRRGLLARVVLAEVVRQTRRPGTGSIRVPDLGPGWGADEVESALFWLDRHGLVIGYYTSKLVMGVPTQWTMWSASTPGQTAVDLFA